MRYTITVKGAPRGKGRPRFTKDGHAYTDEKTRAYEKKIRDAWQSEYKESPLEMPLDVYVLAYYPIPKSWSKVRQKEAEAGLIRPTVKPDADNILKMVDALNGVAWIDDKQIVAMSCKKHYSTEPRLIIDIETQDWLLNTGESNGTD